VHVEMQPAQITRALPWALRDEIVIPRELVAALIKGEEPPDLGVYTDHQREILNLSRRRADQQTDN